MSSGPKTTAQARALKEVRDLLGGGYFLGSCVLDGDTIFLFTDDDGQQKSVQCIRRTIDGPDEWVKVPV